MEMKDKKLATEIAEERMSMIAPLLSQHVDSQVAQLRQEICERNQISQRTLKRYLSAYLSGGFEALKPQSKGAHTVSKSPKTRWTRPFSSDGNYRAGVSLPLFKSWSWKGRPLLAS